MQPDELAPMLAKVSEELAGDRDEAVTAARACELAVEAVEACDHASIALRSRRAGFRTVAASSPVATSVDELQYELEQGPILETVATAEVCRSNDVASDLRGLPRRMARDGALAGRRRSRMVSLAAAGVRRRRRGADGSSRRRARTRRT